MGDARDPVVDNTGLQTLDELIRRRAEEDVQTPILAYPKSPQGVTDYEYFSGRDIDRFIDSGAKALIGKGLKPVEDNLVVGLYANSDRDYLITFLSLVRLGYSGLMLSPRLEATACLSLLGALNANTLLFTPRGADTAEAIKHARPTIAALHVLTREEYDVPSRVGGHRFVHPKSQSEGEVQRYLGFIHSSGSSGTPKPLAYTNDRMMQLLKHARNLTHFLTLPIYHALGMVTVFHCFFKRNTCYMFNGNTPQTHQSLTSALKAANKPQCIMTVPYALKLWAEKQDGIDALKAAKLVIAGGSRIVDELGDLLVDGGVRLASVYGATEVGHLMSSGSRPADDKLWNYLAPPPHIAPFIYWRPYAEDLFELQVLDGHGGKSKTVSNSDDPPNSFRTSDLFEPHPTLPNRWKFIGRIDDRVTLNTGEKVLPLEIEGRLRRDALIKEAVVFGIDRPVPGVLLTRSDIASDLPVAEFIDHVWPTIQYANSRAEAFSQITREMVIVLPASAEIAVTDKMSVKRAKVYQEYAVFIDSAYSRLEDTVEGELQLDVPELERWIINTFHASLGVKLEPQTDFFLAGVDSLKAIQMRGLIVRSLDLGGAANVKEKGGALMVADAGNAARLASFLYALRVGGPCEQSEEIGAMQAVVERLSSFDIHVPVSGRPTPEKSSVLLTGATGSLGIHLLDLLVRSPQVSTIFCPLRASSPAEAYSRIEQTLPKHKLPIPDSLEMKIKAFPSDLGIGGLDLTASMVEDFRACLTHIIHAAWPVNFTLPLSSFVGHLSTLQSLVNLAQSVGTPLPARILFCSSVGAANGAPPGTCVTEAPIPDLAWANTSGYARSKLIGERMLQSAVEHVGARANILRIGQIVPSTDPSSGKLWNPSEMVPLMVRSANIVKSLPRELKGGDACAWLPVDVLARSIMELGHVAAMAKNGDITPMGEVQLVYNLVHPLPFSWAADFLPSLQSAGLQFEEVTWLEWVRRLERSNNDVQRNPTRKLLGFWQKGRSDDIRSAHSKDEPDRADMFDVGVSYETDMAKRDSPAMRGAERLVWPGGKNDYIAAVLHAWREIWP